jgi:hypothetical protein
VSYDEYLGEIYSSHDADNVANFQRTARAVDLHNGVSIRDVSQLTMADLLAQSRRAHRRRPAVEIDGQLVRETLRERLRRESRELEEAVTALAAQLDRRTKQLAHLDRFPESDPFADGDVIAFERNFPHGDQRYSYAAQRADGLWYVTGAKSPNGVSWDKLVDWMGLGVEQVYKLSDKGRRKVIGA